MGCGKDLSLKISVLNCMSTLNANILNNLLSTSRSEMEDAFNAIYSEFSYLVYYVSLQIVKEKEAAEDIANEAFLKFFNNKENVTLNYQSIKYYLVETSKNLSLNYIKVSKRYTEYDDEIGSESETKTKVEQINDFNRYVEQFKDFLNEEEIDLIVMHLLYDFSFKEIAEQRNVSINVISSKYKRTIDKVKKHYKGGKENDK